MKAGLPFPLWVSRTPPFHSQPAHFIASHRAWSPAVGMSIVLGVAEGEVFAHDAEIQKSALQVSTSFRVQGNKAGSLIIPSPSQVITNCVCAPDQSLNSVGAFTPLKPSLHPQQPPGPHNRVLAHMWQVVQNNNGIKVR